MSNITIRLDTKEFEARMNLAATEVVKGLRSVVDKTARAARREAIKFAAEDIGVSTTLAGKNQPLVKATTQGRLSASWTVKPVFVNNHGSRRRDAAQGPRP